MLKGLVLACGAFLVFLISHILLFQIRVPQRRFFTMARIACVIGLSLIAVHRLTESNLGFLPHAYTGAGWAVDLLNAELVFGFLFIGYCMFFFLVDRGFSGRIMIEIENASKQRLRQQDIAVRYSLEMVLQRRLDEMLEIGRVIKNNGRYRNTEKGRLAARLFAFTKRFLQLGEGG